MTTDLCEMIGLAAKGLLVDKVSLIISRKIDRELSITELMTFSRLLDTINDARQAIVKVDKQALDLELGDQIDTLQIIQGSLDLGRIGVTPDRVPNYLDGLEKIISRIIKDHKISEPDVKILKPFLEAVSRYTIGRRQQILSQPELLL